MPHFSLIYSPFAPGIASLLLPVIIVAVVWTIVLKGYSLWYAARNGQKEWFIALLIVNTLGILEIVYLIWFRPKVDSHTRHKPVHTSSPA